MMILIHQYFQLQGEPPVDATKPSRNGIDSASTSFAGSIIREGGKCRYDDSDDDYT